MKELKNACKCIQELIKLNRIQAYNPPENTVGIDYYTDSIEVGTIGFASDIIIDNGDWDDNYNWIADYEINKEITPIEYCPICGKKIEYKKNKSLTKKL